MNKPKDVEQVEETMIEEKLAEVVEDEDVEVIRDGDIEELTKKYLLNLIRFNSSTIHGEEVETSLEKVEEAIFTE